MPSTSSPFSIRNDTQFSTMYGTLSLLLVRSNAIVSSILDPNMAGKKEENIG